MNNNLIQWPKAKYWTAQWNPVIGCKPCSPACEHCYAAVMTKRFGGSFEPHTTKQKPPRKGVVFCGNMTDLFGELVQFPEVAIRKTYINMNPDDVTATYLWLTKRVKHMCATLTRISDVRGRGSFVDYYSKDHYFGFTAENQEWYNKRHREACQLPHWVNWWISAEPLLGPIDLGLSDRHPVTGAFGVIPHPPSWIVVGCESGPKRRPCKVEWVESIVQQCMDAEVPVFVKQICLPNGKFTNKIEEFPKHLQIRQMPWAEEVEK